MKCQRTAVKWRLYNEFFVKSWNLFCVRFVPACRVPPSIKTLLDGVEDPQRKPVSAVMFGLMFVAFAYVLGMAAAAPAWIPVHVVRGNDDVLRVTFSPVDMALRSLEPARYPMFNDLLTATRTPGQRTLTIAEIERELTEKSADSGPGWFENGAQTPHTYARPHPAGFIFHEARVGSTLAANSTS